MASTFLAAEEEILNEVIEDMDVEQLRAKTREYIREERLQKKIITKLERDIDRDRERDKDPRVLAVIRGRKLRYSMKTKEVLLGRETVANVVDVNLLEEAYNTKISRKQAIIKLKRDAEFYIKNIGKRVIFVNGFPIEPGKKGRLSDMCIIEICDLQFIFEINKSVWTKIKKLIIGSSPTLSSG